MDILGQLIVSGIAVGGIYALIALGFVLIYKATSIINFATGEFMMIGAYFFYTFMVMIGLPPVPSFLLVMFCSALLGLFIERAILRHMLGQPTISIVMVTIGLSSILMGLAEMIWSTDFKSFPPLFPRAPVIIGDIIIRSNLFWGFVAAMVAVVFIAVLFKYAKVGVAMRATAGDQMAAFSMGINVRTMFTVAWSLGAIAAALGGVIIQHRRHPAHPGPHRAQDIPGGHPGRPGLHCRSGGGRVHRGAGGEHRRGIPGPLRGRRGQGSGALRGVGPDPADQALRAFWQGRYRAAVAGAERRVHAHRRLQRDLRRG